MSNKRKGDKRIYPLVGKDKRNSEKQRSIKKQKDSLATSVKTINHSIFGRIASLFR